MSAREYLYMYLTWGFVVIGIIYFLHRLIKDFPDDKFILRSPDEMDLLRI
jgi:hypothetical protein